MVIVIYVDRKEFLVGLPAAALAGCKTVELKMVLDADRGQTVAWFRDFKGITTERATFRRDLNGWQIDGEVCGAMNELPLRAKYSMNMDASSRIRWCIVEANYGEQPHREMLSGKEFETVDFALTPSTNTIAINQLRLAVGESREIDVAFIDFPNVRVTRSRQSYARISTSEYEYRNLDTGFKARLHVDLANIVERYERIWQRIGSSAGGPSDALDDARVREFATALASVAPSPELTPGLSDVDWLIGGWAGEVRDYDENGVAHASRGEWWFSWVLEGRAVQDVWMVPPRGQRANATRENNRYGTTLRWFDSTNGLWHVTWRNPVSGARNELAGRRSGDSLVLEGVADGVPIRWSFLNINDSRMHWTGEARTVDGNWQLKAEFFLNRLA